MRENDGLGLSAALSRSLTLVRPTGNGLLLDLVVVVRIVVGQVNYGLAGKVFAITITAWKNAWAGRRKLRAKPKARCINYA